MHLLVKNVIVITSHLLNHSALIGNLGNAPDDQWDQDRDYGGFEMHGMYAFFFEIKSL